MGGTKETASVGLVMISVLEYILQALHMSVRYDILRP